MTGSAPGERPEMIRRRLCGAIDVQRVDVRDDSHLHAGHAGARAGGGHYHVQVISRDFVGRSRLMRHRLVYAAMGDAMRNDCIHALSIEALTPEEAEQT